MICFDTNMMIWSVQAIKPDQDGEKPAKARRYLEFLRSQKKRVALPAPVVTEYLVAFPETERLAQLQLISQNFTVLAFDAATCLFAANLLARKAELQGVAQDCGVSRQLIKVDAMIVAIAARHQVELLISNDDKLRKLAALANVPVDDIPDIREQGSLFARPEL
jgi:predicted nucleic acid-binding protein